MNERKCVICGEPLDGYRNRKYCSKECAAQARRESQKRAVKERGGCNIGDIITCPTCGKNFRYSSGRKKYCSVECKEKAGKMGIGKKSRRSPRRKRVRTLSEILRAARKEHLSYWEYVNKYGL